MLKVIKSIVQGFLGTFFVRNGNDGCNSMISVCIVENLFFSSWIRSTEQLENSLENNVIVKLRQHSTFEKLNIFQQKTAGFNDQKSLLNF